MVDRNIILQLGLTDELLEQEVADLFTSEHDQLLNEVLDKKIDALVPGTILPGKIVMRLGNDVIVELGLKSEGIVDSGEFDDPDEIVAGKEIEVLLEDVDAEGGILLSKRKADRIRGWEHVVTHHAEGDVIKGTVSRRIKGGLLVDIGVPVFLPASQVDIRKPGDISRFIGQEISCKILKIDTENRNIVVSRRKIIEEERLSSKEKILDEIEAGQVRKGVVKNIADFGVFVDLGGLDGLLHISDLSWGRVSHPSEVVHLDEEIECVVIGVDKANEKISLGLKQKAASPWETVHDRYKINSRVTGMIVNIMNYGAFVRLEEGIEGLIHISEMSWTRRVVHPADVLNSGEEVECVVLDINKEKQEISLGLKQLKTNPWAVAAQKYPPGTIVTTRVTSLTSYGAFVEIEPGIDGLVHISDLSWTKKFSHPSDILQKGQELKCLVLDVDEEKHRVSLGIKQMTEDPWIKAIPEKYIPGQIVRGRVTKLTNFGVFIELEPDLEGLLHISELADQKIGSPQEVVSVEEELEVKILRVDNDSRKIGLSLRRVKWAAEDQQKDEAVQQKAPSDGVARRGGLDGSLMPGSFSLSDEPKPVVAETQPEQAEVAETQPEPAEESSEPAAETQPEQAEETQPEPAEADQADAASPESAEAKADEQAPESEEASSESDSQDEPVEEASSEPDLQDEPAVEETQA